jgi:glycine/D-amino acid oxidase-like deaminating enzyme
MWARAKAAMKTDVLVVGGGLTGAATAYFLAREGVDVLLIEQFELNTQASGANAGSIHAQIAHEPFVEQGEDWARVYAPTIPLMMASIDLWSELQREIGPDLGVQITGGLIVAESAEQMSQIERKVAIERRQKLPVDLLDRDALRRLAPYVSERMVGGAFCPIEGKANPLLATGRIAAAATDCGARVLTHVRLEGLEADDRGFRAATSRGSIAARRIVDCAGADAGRVARMVGIELPIEGHAIQVSVTEKLAPLVPHLVYFAGGKLSLKQTSEGTLLIGGGWPAHQDASGLLSVDPHSLAANLATALRVVPRLHDVSVVRTWPAIVNGTADWKPIVGEIPRVPGFYLAMFPWMGFTAGPIAARLVSQVVQGQQPDYDLSHFSVERY